MDTHDDSFRVRAAAVLLLLFAAPSMSRGDWPFVVVLSALAWTLSAGIRPVRWLCFAAASLLGASGAFGLTKFALREAGLRQPPPPAVPLHWLAFFAALSVFFLALAVLLWPGELPEKPWRLRLSKMNV